ncbi:hypothetical protein [Halobaculum sp. D14]|uniref:hypothetical protein n=1 Tax=Halobaculum sp. D14 TaxID=3421642 RepID=UPI003EBCF188
MSQGAYGQGFVERVVEAADRVEAELAPAAPADAVAARLRDALFGGVLGFDAAAVDTDGAVVRFRDDAGDTAIVFAAAGRDQPATAAVSPAFEAASSEPYVRYVVAGTLDRLIVFERVDDAADADTETETVHGVTAGVHTDIPLADVVAAGRRGRLSQTLRPGQQLAVAKLTALRPEELSAEERYDEYDTPGKHSVAEDDGLDTLVGTLRDCLTDVLVPAVETALDDVSGRVDGYEDRAEALRAAVDEDRRAAADDTAAGAARSRLLAHRDANRDVRLLRAAYGSWVRGANRTGYTPSENERAFARVAAFALLEDVFVVRVAEGMGLQDDVLTGDAVDRFEEYAESFGVDRDVADLLRVARESFGHVYERRTPALGDWALGHDDVAEALGRVVWYCNHFAFDVDADRAATAYGRLLGVVDLPELDYDPDDAVPAAALDRAGYTADAAIDAADADLLDPAAGDGRFVLEAADRLLARLDAQDADPRRRVDAVCDRLTAADDDPLSARVTETRLLLRLLDDYQEARWEESGFTIDPLGVYAVDPLRRDDGQTTLAAPAAHADAEPGPLDREDYAYVVGRFPATLRRDIADGPAADAYADYETAYYTYDTSALYVERAADWLGENGTLAAVAAGRFRDTRFGTRLREHLPQWYRLDELRELSGTAAGGAPVLLVARRFRKNEPVVSPDEYEPPTYRFRYVAGDGADPVELPSALLGGDHWTFDADELATQLVDEPPAE